MHTLFQRSLAAAALLAATSLTWAQAAPAPAASTPGVDARQARQAHRIEQGAASGALTGREQRRLHREQHAIAHAEDKAKADGTVTRQERRRLHHMQDHASHDIKRQKHDGQHRGMHGGMHHGGPGKAAVEAANPAQSDKPRQ